jgi:hypothetical protein
MNEEINIGESLGAAGIQLLQLCNLPEIHKLFDHRPASTVSLQSLQLWEATADFRPQSDQANAH